MSNVQDNAAPGIDLSPFRELVEACEDVRAASEDCDIGEGLAHAVPFHLWNEFLSKLDAAQHVIDASPKGARDAAELLSAARDFYNGTIADPAVRISCSTKERRDRVKAIGERLRDALKAARTGAPGVQP